MQKAPNILNSPAILRRTQRILALKAKYKDAVSRVNFIVADLGDELLAVNSALKGNYGAWSTWLRDHVDFDIRTAQLYMKVAQLRNKAKTFSLFARLDLSALEKIAALPDNLLTRLENDPRLPNPKTGAPTPIDQLSARALIQALEILRGRSPREPLPAGSKNGNAQAACDYLRKGFPLFQNVNNGAGKLDPAWKRLFGDLLEQAREDELHWKAWVTPQKGKRLR